MIEETIGITKVTAKDGYLLTNGDVTAEYIYLGVADSIAAWWEIPNPDCTPDADGSYLHPYIYSDGISVKNGLWYYTDDPQLPHEAIKDGAPSNYYDREYFDFVE